MKTPVRRSLRTGEFFLYDLYKVKQNFTKSEIIDLINELYIFII